MKDVIELFYNLPIELRSKIVYSGYIISPTAIILKNLKKEIKEYNERRWSLDTMNYEEATFYNILKDLNYLRDTELMLQQEIFYLMIIYGIQ